MQIDYVYSPGSPFSFLGHAELGRIAARHGASIRHRPVDLGRIFAATGGLKLHDRAPERQRYRLVEIERWGRIRGIPIRPDPHCHGASRELGAGLVIAAQELGYDPFALAEWIMQTCWLHDRDIADAEMLGVLRARFGLYASPDAALSAPIQAIWRANTEAAIAEGVFGAPTYIVDGEMFWGQDRLELVEEALRLKQDGRFSA